MPFFQQYLLTLCLSLLLLCLLMVLCDQRSSILLPQLAEGSNDYPFFKAIQYFKKLRYVHYLFRYHAIAHLRDYSIVQTQFMYWATKTNSVTHFIVIFASLLWCVTEPVISSRCAVLCLVTQSCPTLQPQVLSPTRLLCPWGFSRQEYWSGLPCLPPGESSQPRD